MADICMPKPPSTTRSTTTSAILETAAWAAKILFLLIGIASTAVLTARLASPHFPKLWGSALSFLAPPYLFLAVHFIIMLIWRLHHNQTPDQEASITAVETTTQAEIIPDQEADPPENEDSATRQQWPPPDDDNDNDEADVQEEIKEIIQEEADSIDATWKAIMASKSSPAQKQLTKSDTWEKPKSTLARAAPVQNKQTVKKEMRKSKTFRESSSSNTSNVGWRGRDVLVIGHDELFRKVESFIKMNYEQMRAKRRESQQPPPPRYVDQMANAAY